MAGYTLGITVPPAFSSNYRLYQHALADTAPPPVDRAALAQRIGRALSDNWAETVRSHDRTSIAAQAIDRATTELGKDSEPVPRLRGAAQDLDRIALAIEEPASTWLVDTEAGLDSTLESLLAEIRDVAGVWGPPLDPRQLIERLRLDALAEQELERQRLTAAPIFGVSPSLVRSEGKLRLALPLARARTSLAAYLNQPLLHDTRLAGRARPSWPGERLIWDVGQLRELLTAAEGSLLADTRDLAGLPLEVAALAKRASAPALAAIVDTALGGVSGLLATTLRNRPNRFVQAARQLVAGTAAGRGDRCAAGRPDGC